MNQDSDHLDSSKQQLPADLLDLATMANREHVLCRNALRTAIAHAAISGQCLCAVKDRLDHGQFTAWLEQHFRASVETARVYMRIWKRWEEISAELERNPDLTLEDALQFLKLEKKSFMELPTTDEDEDATANLREQARIFIKELTVAERAFLASGADLLCFLRNLQREIKPLAPVFADARAQSDAVEKRWSEERAWENGEDLYDLRAAVILEGVRRCPSLTEYQRKTVWDIVQRSNAWKGKPWLVSHLKPRREMDEMDLCA